MLRLVLGRIFLQKNMKTSKIAFLILSFVLATTFVSAQKPKPTPKPKIVSKTVKKPAPKAAPKTEEPSGLFDFLDDPKYQESLKNLNSAERNQAEEFFKKGLAHWKNLDISEAIESYTKAIEIYPNYIEALRERGRIYSMIDKGKEAVPDLTAFLKTEPNNVEFLNLRGLAYSGIVEKLLEDEADDALIDENGNKALADFNSIIKIEPNNVYTLTNRGKLFIDFNSFDDAIKDLEKAVSLDSKYALAYSYLGLAKFYKTSAFGITDMNRAIQLDPKSAVAYYNRGNFHRASQDLEKAIADYTQAILLHGTKPKYYNSRGMTYFRLGDGVAAVQDFSTAVAQNPAFARGYYNRGYTYKKFPAAAADRVSKDSVYEGIALQHRKMMNDFTLAIKYNPKLADAYIERGLMRSTSTGINIDGLDAETIAELNLALADFQQAVKLNPKSAEAFNGRASCYDQLGKKDLALADYTKAIKLDPELATAYMGRMAIYCEMGKKELSFADEKKIKELGFAAINMCRFGK